MEVQYMIDVIKWKEGAYFLPEDIHTYIDNTVLCDILRCRVCCNNENPLSENEGDLTASSRGLSDSTSSSINTHPSSHAQDVDKLLDVLNTIDEVSPVGAAASGGGAETSNNLL